MARLISPAIRLFTKDKWIRATFLPTIGLCLLALLGLVRFFPHQDNAVLHYNVYFGIDLLGPWSSILLIPASTLTLVVLNGVAAAYLWRSDRVVSYFLGVGTLFITVTAVVGALLLWYLNV